ncbi:MAG TPA: DMT family transporter [Hyphomicrobiales bacterium]
MELWIPITIAAAFFQNLRFMLQKRVKGRLSTFGATFARFVWAAPLAAIFVWLLLHARNDPLPGMTGSFFGFALIGGLAQILATALVVSLFSLRNFAVGVALSKTETVQTVIFGILILGEVASAPAIFAIVVSLAGVVLISVQPAALSAGGPFNRSALLGIASGAFFGVSAVCYRGAALSLESGDFLIRAALTLAVVTLMQTVLMSAYLAVREPGEIGRVFAAWRVTMWIGATGMIASLAWFAAMTLQNAAYVRALGQVELVFTFATSALVFGERSTRREIVGILLLVVGILLLLVGR